MTFFSKTLKLVVATLLEPQINSLLRSVHMVRNLGAKLGDNIVAAAIVSALPNSLAMLKTILANSTKECSPIELKARILGDEQCRIRESGIGATAFFTKASKKTKESKDKEKEKAKKHCTHCDICGHDVSECRKLKKEQEAEGTAKAQTSSMPTSANPKVNAPKDSTTTSANVATALSSNQHVVCLFKAVAQMPAKGSMITPQNAAMALSTTELVIHLFMALTLVGGTNALSATPLANIKHEWITDLGASHTMCSNRSWFTQFSPLSPPIEVALGDNSIIPATGMGRVHMRMQANNQWNEVILQDVLFMPDLHGNLLSVTQLTAQGGEIRFKDHFCRIYCKDELTGKGTRQGDLYVMDTKTVGVAMAYIAEVNRLPEEGEEIESDIPTMSTSSKAMLSTWH